QRGITFPKQLAFIGYGDPPAYKWIAGGISTISLPTDDIAERAIAMIIGHRGAPIQMASRTPTALILRKSA
ncbi:MAG: hypothetical protein C0508_30135, partial [Cyanobacteria bacterium PR.023]|nr:hypothetical protein [Cyanobacteria bacterium PR.023]